MALAIGGTPDAELPSGRTGTYPRLLRWEEDAWSESVLPEELVRTLELPPEYGGIDGGTVMLLSEVFWESPRVVWLVAHGADLLGLGSRVLRSDDRGRTWAEATHLLPEVFRYRGERDVDPRSTLDDVWFEDALTWWVAGGYRGGSPDIAIGPAVWKTEDAGATWAPVVRLREALGPAVFLGRSTNEPDLTYQRWEGSGAGYASIVRSLAPPHEARPVSPELDLRDYAHVGTRRWAIPSGAGGGVWTSSDGRTWSEQEIDGVPPAGPKPGEGPVFAAIELIDATTGVACGGTDDVLGVPTRPYCAHTTTGGEPWLESAFVGPRVNSIAGVALLDERRGWGIGRLWSGVGIGAMLVGEFRMFETLDGGATFEHTSTPFDGEMTLYGLAVSP